jgi:hypothetical protein
VTVPVGVPAPPGVTVAVNVMLDPTVIVEADAVSAVVVEVVTTGALP